MSVILLSGWPRNYCDRPVLDLYLLGQHYQVEAKLVEELTAVLGDREPTAEDLPPTALHGKGAY